MIFDKCFLLILGCIVAALTAIEHLPCADYQGLAAENDIAMAEFAYEQHKGIRAEHHLKRLNQHFGAVGANWPCIWGKQVIGNVNVSNNRAASWRYTCGIKHLWQEPQASCVIYTIGGTEYGFEKGLHELKPGCELHLFDSSDTQLNEWFHAAGQPTKIFHHPHINAFSLPELKQLMTSQGHKHVDILSLHTKDSDFTQFEGIWPSVGQVYMHVQFTGSDAYLRLFNVLENVNFRLFHKEVHAALNDKHVQLSWIQKDWFPCVKDYSSGIEINATLINDATYKGHYDIAEFTYDKQKVERRPNKISNMNQVLGAFVSNWPCFGTEGITGSLDTWLHHYDKFTDGWKFTCGLTNSAPNPSRPCVVYSLGSCGNMAFEQDVLRRRSDCKIFIFDKDSFGLDQWFTADEIKQSVVFTRAFISNASDPAADPPRRTIQSIMEEYHHDHIDMLKMDIEGEEFGVLSGKLPEVDQLQVEVHMSKHPTQQHLAVYGGLVANIESNGLRMFHKELNAMWDIHCIELAFVHRNWKPYVNQSQAR